MGFQVAQGNFVFLLFPLGSEVVREEIICVGLKRLGLPWAGAGSPLQGGASLTATDSGPQNWRGLKGRHLRILRGLGALLRDLWPPSQA